MRTRRGQEGVSMIEMTAAVFVVIMGVFGALQMYCVGMNKTRMMQENAAALAAAENELETLRAAPFASLSNGEALPFRSETAGLAGLREAEAGVWIADHPAAPGVKTVRVTVAWIGKLGQGYTERSLTTLIADLDGNAPDAE